MVVLMIGQVLPSEAASRLEELAAAMYRTWQYEVCVSSEETRGWGPLDAPPWKRTISPYVRLSDGRRVARAYFWTVTRLKVAKLLSGELGRERLHLEILLKSNREVNLKLGGSAQGMDAVTEDAYLVAVRRRWDVDRMEGEAFSDAEMALKSAREDRRPFYRKGSAVYELEAPGGPARLISAIGLPNHSVDCVTRKLDRVLRLSKGNP
jgi:hypothetical protein